MALTDAKVPLARRPLFRMPARVQAWLAGEHAPTQRMAGAAFIIRVMSAAIVFLSQILLARWMGGFEFGVYVMVSTWLLVASELSHLAFPLTAQRFIPEYTQLGALDRLRGFLTGSRWVAFGTATAVSLVGAFIVRLLETSLDRHAIMPLYLACVAMPFYSFSFMLDGIARSYNWIGLALVPHSILRPIGLLLLIGAMYALGFPVDATATIAALAIAIWIMTLVQLVMLERRLATAVPSGPKTYDFKAWFATSLPIMTMWGFYTLLIYTDVLVLQQFRGPEEVAHYYAASKTLALVAFIYFAVAGTAAHRFTAYHVAGDKEGLAEFAAKSVRWIFWPSLAAIVLILVLGKPTLWLFGPKFVEAYPFMFVLALGFIARAAVGPAERLLNMVGQQRLCALAYATAFVVNLTGCIVLAGPYGGMGVAIATAAAFVVESGLLFLIAKRRLGLHLLIWRP